MAPIGKDDFFPGRSFRSLREYADALVQTPSRLSNRMFTRADPVAEMSGVRARSRNDMKRTLNWWDLGWLAVGAVIGAGIFVLSGVEAHEDTGPAIILSFVAAGFAAMLAVFCYTEFAVEIPVAGGSFAYLRVELGDFVAFIAAGNIVLECLIGSAALGRAWTSYFAKLCNHNPDDFRIYISSLADGYNLLDPLAVGVLIISGVIASLSTKIASYLNWIASSLNMFLILFVIVAGLINADPANYRPFLPFGVRGVFKGASVVFFAYLGFDTVCTVAEETKNPKRDIPIGLFASMTVVTILYCLMAVTLCLMQKYTEVDINAPFSAAFSNAVGWKWAQYLVALGALKSMSSVLLVGSVGQARYLAHMARTHILPPCLAYVNERTGTPVLATMSIIIASCFIAFFTELRILSNLLSISTLFIFMLVALSLIVRRHYVTGQTSSRHQRLLILFLAMIIGSSVAIAAYWGVTEGKGWILYPIAVPIWFLSTLGLAVFVPKARQPKFWGVPFVPWVPSLSVATNSFLLGSMDRESYIRFGLWTVLMLIYYVFYGLHASHDAAQEMESSYAAGLNKIADIDGENGYQSAAQETMKPPTQLLSPS
ncbi:hypothetical protein KP509_11G017600 [Ceratopteris richardii]|uniref:Cationic amino acid transporter C-terminal domain-containing protein n=1 Tax=Ceratopteris richardii TaxID=49495 RepID=A0A8T2TQQ5_CERRI|nr:hypothetical protein KP509_11G017600 [Ceratopteris richardii]